MTDTYVEPDDGLADYTDDDLLLDPIAARLPDLSDETWPAPPEPDGGQDDEAQEGRGALGGIPEYVRPAKEALALLTAYIRSGKTVEPGYCLRETRSYFAVEPYYLAAKDSLAGAKALGVAHRVELTEEGCARIPQAAIVYMVGPRSQFGHTFPSFGGGFGGSTDWPTGRYGRVSIYVLAKAWGYTEVWWAPCVNDVRVWRPRKARKATPLITKLWATEDEAERVKLLEKLAEKGDGSQPDAVKRAAARVLSGRDDREDGRVLLASAERKTRAGRQALHELEVEK